MRKLRILGLLIAMSFIVGCSAIDDLIGGEEKANILGTWDYTFESTKCEGLVAEGIEIIESNNGNTAEVGNITIQGTTLALDYSGNCYLSDIDYTTTSFVGSSSTVEESEYMNSYLSFFFSGIQGYITGSTIYSYSTSLISMKLDIEDGSTMYIELTKQQD